MAESVLAGTSATESVVVARALALPSGNGSIFTGPRLSLSIAIRVASPPEICRRIRVLLCRPRRPQGFRVRPQWRGLKGSRPLGRLGSVVCQRAGKPLRVKTAVEVGLPLQLIENISAKHFSRAHHAVPQVSGAKEFTAKAGRRGA